MFIILQVLSIFALIILLQIYNYKFAKKKLKNAMIISISIYTIISGIIANLFLETIPLPTEVATITALGEQNENALADEVRLVLLNISGEKYTDFTPIDGKWMLSEELYYMWRNELDPRQPDGLTRQIKVEVPVGLERLLTFASSDTSGMVRVEFAGETQIVDLYSETKTVKQVEVTATPNSQMQKLKIVRLCYWYTAIGVILLLSALVVHLYKKYPNFRNVIPLTVIILLQVGVMIYYGYQKEGYYGDGVWQFELANRSYHNEGRNHLRHNPYYYNNWHSYSYYWENIIVRDDQIFRYDITYDNTTRNVHPPLSYFITHTISSMFPETLSKWYGISTNIIFFILAIILLYKISNLIFKDNIIKWLPILLWGFSIVSISVTILIRMYIMLTFAGLLFVYIYINYIHDKEITNKAMFLTIVATYLGCMSQYYFLIFAFIFTFIISVIKFLRQRYKEMFQYGLSVTTGVALLFVTYPAAYNHIFGDGYRGKEAFENAEDITSIPSNLKKLFNYTITDLLGGSIGKYLLYLLTFILICFLFNKLICKVTITSLNGGKLVKFNFDWFNKKEVSISLVSTNFIVVVITITILLYMVMIALVSSASNMRYIYLIQPLFGMTFIYWFYIFIKTFNFDNRITQCLLSVIVVFIVVLGFKNSTPSYLYPNDKYMMEYAKENSSIPVITVSKSSFLLISNYLEFSKYDSGILMVTEDNINKLPILTQEKKSELEKIILYVTTDSDKNEILKYFTESMGYQNVEELCESNSTLIYRLSGLE